MIKRRNGKAINSIGEEIDALTAKVKANVASPREIRRLISLKREQKTKNAFGKVFIARAKEFGDPTDHGRKTRRVVALQTNSAGAKVAPVQKANSVLALKGFDGDRVVDVRKSKWLPWTKIYHKGRFPKTENDRLTRAEKRKLLKKAIKYK